MIAEYLVIRMVKNDITFVKLLSEKKIEFYAKLKNIGVSKNKFFRICFHAFMDENPDFMKVVTNKDYNYLVKDEVKAFRALRSMVQNQEAGYEHRKLLKRQNELDLVYYFKEEDYIDYEL
jgi:hypothetical protein